MNITPIHFSRLVRATENRDINNIGMRFPLLDNHVSQGAKVFSLTRDGTQIISVVRDRP